MERGVHRVALFKISKGNESNLPITHHAGYMYITEDTGLIYVDMDDSENGR